MDTAQQLPLSRTAQVLDLVLQNRAFDRLGYDGHGRRSGLTTMHRLGLRRSRRIWRRRLASFGWASPGALTPAAVA